VKLKGRGCNPSPLAWVKGQVGGQESGQIKELEGLGGSWVLVGILASAVNAEVQNTTI